MTHREDSETSTLLRFGVANKKKTQRYRSMGGSRRGSRKKRCLILGMSGNIEAVSRVIQKPKKTQSEGRSLGNLTIDGWGLGGGVARTMKKGEGKCWKESKNGETISIRRNV